VRDSPRWLRLGIHLAFSLLWIAGAAVFVLKRFFPVDTELGPAPHPSIAPLLLVHGIVAVLVTFLFGFIAAAHVRLMWRVGADRASGLWLLSLVPILIVTGFAGFFLVADSVRDWNGLLHGVLGLALIAPWLVHLFGRRRRLACVSSEPGRWRRSPGRPVEQLDRVHDRRIRSRR
jgi:hypothetical protein